MKPKFDTKFWAHRLNSVKAKIQDEEFWVPIMRDLETASRDVQFRKEFVKANNFDVFQEHSTVQEIFSYVEKSVMGELRMIGQFNKGLKKELFEKTRVNVKLSKMVIPSITTLWLFTTDTFTMNYKALLNEHVIEYILSWLNPLYVNEAFLQEKDRLFGGCLSILWNSICSDSDMKYPIRKHMAPHIETVKCMSEDFSFDQRILALTCILLLTDHERKSDLTTTSADINILIKALHETVESKGGDVVISNATYKLSELLIIFVNISENDTTKDILIDLHIVDSLLHLLPITSLDRDQRIQTLQLLHKLSFKIKTRSGLTDFTKRALDDFLITTNDFEIVELCKRVIFELDQKKRLKESVNTPLEDKYRKPKHVLISYNWGSQPLALKLKSCLKGSGIPTWMDVENMGADTLASMAEAVENAFCVLVCVSEKYKESSACRSEAEYSYNLHKDTVPIMMEKAYSPTGWLGILCGTKKYYQWFNETTIATSTPALVNYLLAHPHAHRSLKEESVEEPALEAKSCSVTSATPKQLSTTDSKEIFMNKLTQHSLGKLKDKFGTFDIDMLKYLQEMERRSPDFLWTTLETQYGMHFQEIIQFCVLLKQSNFD
ncbi:uncharacterized protein LOC142343176 [Convolutriloba macropyga]|uniref:uncharacterized protein LOC142343176 n=1 Tax=Convolutriloba macropyga TaxID=536237 RepID=UPI003F51BEF7